MAIKTIKTKYYYSLLDRGKSGRSNRSSKPPTGEHNFNLGEHNYNGEVNSNPSILRRDRETRYITLEVNPVKQNFPSNSIDIKKQTGKFPKFLRNISLRFGKKVIKDFPLAKLVFKNGKLAGEKRYIFNINPVANPGGYIKIGRKTSKGKGNRYFLSIADRSVSRDHAKIVYLNGRLIVVNYSSINPTQLNGRPIPVNASAYIQDGAIIRIGDIELVIEKIKFP